MVEHTKRYYNSDIIGSLYGLSGAGLIGLMSGDQLHPPMIYDEEIWRDGNRWKEGAIKCCERLASLAKINGSSLVLDVGSGIGGPGRYLAHTFGCRVVGLNISELQTKTAKRLTKETSLENLVGLCLGDAEDLPFKDEAFSVVWTMNMFYHIQNKPKTLREFYRVLKPNGILAFDDWVITKDTKEEEHQKLKQIWQNPSFGTIEEYMSFMESIGFKVEDIVDVSNVGRELMPKHFEREFDRCFCPIIKKLLPEYGEELTEILKRDIKFTIKLYQENKFGYFRLIARK
ncbi:MAG: methyltransferase domain-containing protein [Nanoarchaeota archaeon]